MDTSLIAPLCEAANRAILCMKNAMEAGLWDPTPDLDPIPAMESVEKSLSRTSGCVDLSRAHDLADIALHAIEAGDWVQVSEQDISNIQRFNFLTSLADDMAPVATQVALAM